MLILFIYNNNCNTFIAPIYPCKFKLRGATNKIIRGYHKRGQTNVVGAWNWRKIYGGKAISNKYVLKILWKVAIVSEDLIVIGSWFQIYVQFLSVWMWCFRQDLAGRSVADGDGPGDWGHGEVSLCPWRGPPGQHLPGQPVRGDGQLLLDLVTPRHHCRQRWRGPQVGKCTTLTGCVRTPHWPVVLGHHTDRLC